VRPDRLTAFFSISLPFLALGSFPSGFNSHLRQLSIVRCPPCPGLRGLVLCRLGSCWLIFFIFELTDLLSSSGCSLWHVLCALVQSLWLSESSIMKLVQAEWTVPSSDIRGAQWSAMDAETSRRHSSQKLVDTTLYSAARKVFTKLAVRPSIFAKVG
jgi:hypothetical protein